MRAVVQPLDNRLPVSISLKYGQTSGRCRKAGALRQRIQGKAEPPDDDVAEGAAMSVAGRQEATSGVLARTGGG